MPILIGTLAAVLMFYLTEPPQLALVKVVAPNRDLAPGTRIEATDLRLLDYPADYLAQGMITNPDDIVGTYVRQHVAAGSPLFSHMLSRMPLGRSNTVAFPISVSQATAGLVSGDDIVDIYALPSRNEGSLNVPITERQLPPILRGVRVIAVLDRNGQLIKRHGTQEGFYSSIVERQTAPDVAIVEVSPEQANILAFYRQNYTFVLSVRTEVVNVDAE